MYTHPQDNQTRDVVTMYTHWRLDNSPAVLSHLTDVFEGVHLAFFLKLKEKMEMN